MENRIVEVSDVLSRIVHQVILQRNQIDMSGMLLTEDDIQVQLSRRRPGQSALTTAVLFLSIFTDFSAMRKIEYKYNLEQSSIRL